MNEVEATATVADTTAATDTADTEATTTVDGT